MNITDILQQQKCTMHIFFRTTTICILSAKYQSERGQGLMKLPIIFFLIKW